MSVPLRRITVFIFCTLVVSLLSSVWSISRPIIDSVNKVATGPACNESAAKEALKAAAQKEVATAKKAQENAQLMQKSKAALEAQQKELAAMKQKLEEAARQTQTPAPSPEPSPEPSLAPVPTVIREVHVPPPPTKPFSEVFPGFPNNIFAKFDSDENTELRNCAHRLLNHMQHRDHFYGYIGWEDEAILGTIMITDGKRAVWRQHTKKHHQDEKYRTWALENTIISHMQELKKPTIIFLPVHDIDYWSLIAHSKYNQTRKDMHQIMDECPMIWMAHFNPCTMNHTNGRLPRRQLVVPDFYKYWEELTTPPNFADRDLTPKVVWRGSALGQGRDLSAGGPYNDSDRYRIIKTLGTSLQDIADVGYTGFPRSEDQGSPPGLKPTWMTMHEQVEKYRALLDVDGVANTWEALRVKLGLGAPLLKAYSTWGCTQWFYPELTHGKELMMFDTFAPEEEIRTLLQDTFFSKEGGGYANWTSSKLGMHAFKFARERLTYKAAQSYLMHLIQRLWDDAEALNQKDWRIRNFTIPTSRLGPYQYKFDP